MNIDTLKDVFNWLENEVNKNGLFYFKLINDNEIIANWNDDNTTFAIFYINKIIKLIEYERKYEVKELEGNDKEWFGF